MKRAVEQVSSSLTAKPKITTWVATMLATVLPRTLSAILPPHSQSSVLTMTLMQSLKTQGVETLKLTSWISEEHFK